MHKSHYYVIIIYLINITGLQCDVQIGPDPWDYVSPVTVDKDDVEVQPDIKTASPDIKTASPDIKTASPEKVQKTNNMGTGEWFYKRILAIVLKGGQIKKHEDGSVEVSLQMRYNMEHWNVLTEYILANNALSEDMYRRSMGYIEEAIYKPTITEKIVMAWSEYIQFYLIEYKTELTWGFSILTCVAGTIWFWNHMAHKHVIVLIIIGLYLYEVFTSYKVKSRRDKEKEINVKNFEIYNNPYLTKEAEKQELDKFMRAVNTCKWYIWTSECEVPPPDPLIFIKHMNPLKIGVRMFTTLLSEPMISINEAVKVMIHGITDGLWYPFNVLMYGFLVITFTVILIFLLVMITFNYILNIPFNLSIFGLVNIGLKQRNRSMPAFRSDESPPVQIIKNGDRISEETLHKFLDVCSQAITTASSTQIAQKRSKETLSLTNGNKIKRSASTGRLPNLTNN